MSNQRLAAWGVHFYTSLGLPCALLAFFALRAGDLQGLFFWLGIAVIIDSSDGMLARHYRVKEVLPDFDGRKLDDIIDFITYAFLPAIALVELGLLPAGREWVAALPVMASGYGFSQERAKTEDSFVGFPSYWNVAVFYMYFLGWPQGVNATLIILLAVLVFVPIHYLYPNRAQWLMPLTMGLAILWGVVLLAVILNLDAPWVRPAVLSSLIFPAYYTILSLVHHRKIRLAELA